MKRADLRKIAVDALREYPTLARERVYSPGAMPGWDGLYPMIRVTTPLERKQSDGPNGAPSFTTTISLLVEGTVAALDQDQALVDVETLCEQIERALINFTPLMRQLQQIAFVETRTETAIEGKIPLGKLTMVLGLETHESDEDFAPIVSDPLCAIDLKVANEVCPVNIVAETVIKVGEDHG